MDNRKVFSGIRHNSSNQSLFCSAVYFCAEGISMSGRLCSISCNMTDVHY